MNPRPNDTGQSDYDAESSPFLSEETTAEETPAQEGDQAPYETYEPPLDDTIKAEEYPGGTRTDAREVGPLKGTPDGDLDEGSYPSGKPRRIIIRAQTIHDQS